MHGSADMAGMSDGRSCRTFFRLAIVCRDQPPEMKLESIPDISHVEMRAIRGPFVSMRFGRIFSLAVLSSSFVAAFRDPNSDKKKWSVFCDLVAVRHREIIAPEAPHSHATNFFTISARILFPRVTGA